MVLAEDMADFTLKGTLLVVNLCSKFVSVRIFALVVLIGICFTPLATTGLAETMSMSLSQDDDGLRSVPRVYGADYSREIYSAVTAEIYEGFVRNFSDIGERHILEAADAYVGNNRDAREYIVERMNTLSNGRMEVQIIETHLNVVGKLPGYLPGDNPGFVIVGHYDSWYTGLGTNEGAAGIGAILSLVEPLSRYEWPLDIYFVATNGRYAQWGPFGAPEMALWFQNQGADLLTVYTLEALLVPDNEAPHDERVHMVYLNAGAANYHLGQYWAELARTMSKNIGANLIKAVPHTDFFYWGGRYLEATYYQERGYLQSMVAIESNFENDEDIRTPEDNWANPSYRYYLGREIAGAVGASIAFTMSRAYGQIVQYDSSFELERATRRSYYLPISGATTINVSSRWFGGTAEFEIEDPTGAVIAHETYDHTSAWEPTTVFSLPVTQKGLYTLRVSNTGFSAVGHVLRYSYDSDIDGNGIPDSEEYWLDTALFHHDADLDSISDAMEIIIGTDMNSADSDSDSMPDSYELAHGFDPMNAADAAEDADGDTLTNAFECSLGTDPLNIDSDSDMIPDNWEIQYGLDPLRDDAAEDPDKDEKSNLEEYRRGSNPMVAERGLVIPPFVWILPPSIVVLCVGFYTWNRRRRQPVEETYYF
jgi:hypothetical protein